MITRPTGHLTQYLESMEKIDQAISFFEKNNPESIELSVLVGGSRLPIVPPCFTYNTSCFMGFLGLRFNVFNLLSAKCVIFYHKNLRTMSESETTSASSWKVIRDGEAGRRGARWEEVI